MPAQEYENLRQFHPREATVFRGATTFRGDKGIIASASAKAYNF